MKSYSASAGGSTTAHSQASDISCVSGSTSGWEHMQDSVDDDDHDESSFKDRPIMQRSQSAQPTTRNKVILLLIAPLNHFQQKAIFLTNIGKKTCFLIQISGDQM
jgi:hypothetical protein